MYRQEVDGNQEYSIILASQAKGVLYVTQDCPYYISGQIRVRGRGTLADRQQGLNGMLHKIIRLAEIFNIAVVITNQVQSSPDTFFGDPTKAAGGKILAREQASKDDGLALPSVF